jgi:periplasmic divalent cation tolerance protein
MLVFFLVVDGHAGGVVDGWILAAPVGIAFDDQFVGGGGEPVNGGLGELCEVVISAPETDWLRVFSRQLVEDRLCASAHNFHPVASVYRWRGEIHERTEGRVSLHTSRARVPEIVARAKQQHPMQQPPMRCQAYPCDPSMVATPSTSHGWPQRVA